MRSLAAIIVLVGCGGGATAPAIAPTTPVSPVVTSGAPDPAQAGSDTVAIIDPCDGGEVTGGGEGQPGTGAGSGYPGGSPGDVGTLAREPGDGMPIGAQQLPAIKVGVPTVEGKLEVEIIRRIVRRHLNELRFCYEKHLAANPNASGLVVAKFVIARDGTVASATAAGVHADVERCIAGRIRTWVFPKPADGEVTVSQPFTLSPR